MKKIFAILAFGILTTVAGYGQYFQGNFSNTGNTLVFKMRPTATLTTAISYMEFCFRYETATTPSFSIANLENGTAFPGLNLQRRPDFVSGPYTYVRYVHNTSTVASTTYTAGVEYEIGRLNLIGSGVGDFEMASDLVDPNNETVFGVLDGSGTLIDPGPGDQLYGPGFNIDGNLQLLPLIDVPIPVKFLSFSASKSNRDALLKWEVENEDANTSHYELERSTNGTEFSKFTSIPKKENGLTNNSYTSTDANASARVSSVNGIIYYRIKQIDKDGRFLYTETRNVKYGGGKGFGASVFPNPVQSLATLNIDLERAGNINIIITDASGKEVKRFAVNGAIGGNTKQIDMSEFASGTYMLKVTSGTENQVLSVVKR